jgi:hypothetical protein
VPTSTKGNTSRLPSRQGGFVVAGLDNYGQADAIVS